jgi:hypothetical protein
MRSRVAGLVVDRFSQAPMKSWPRRLGWLLLIWLASITALAVVAALFRVLMNAAGLTA